MGTTLHLYAGGSDLSNATGIVGLLCEFAPDSAWLKSVEYCYTADEILGSADEALLIAYSLVSKLLRSAPRIEGLSPLHIFEEDLLEQVSYIVQAFHLDYFISSHGFATCHFVSYSPWLDRLCQARSISGSGYALVSDMSLVQASQGGRTVRKLLTSRPRVSELFQRLAPLWSRYLSVVPMREKARRAQRGGIWFYSTSYNCTQIGLEYESYLPERLNFLVEDASTGGRRLRELGREWHSLYAWTRATDIPSKAEAHAAADRIRQAIEAVPLPDEESALRVILLKGEWWQHFVARYLAFTLYNSRALERWWESVTPEMIVVGNTGWERALLLRESTAEVPAVMLQHGIMHWVFAVADQPVDLFFVRGPFFQRCLNKKLRDKTVIRNSSRPTSLVQSAKTDRKDVLFITQPYGVTALFHPADLRDILGVLLRVSHACGRRLIIRVHPTEKVSTYEKEVSEIQTDTRDGANVVYSQGPGAEELLARSSVAVLHSSTMFLDCLRHGIPIVSFGWHWFPNRRHFEEEGVFNFASDLKHFEALIRRGIQGCLPQPGNRLEEFMAHCDPLEIAKTFEQVWKTRRSLA